MIKRFKGIGYWQTSEHPEYQDPLRFVGSWLGDDKGKVVTYLDACPVASVLRSSWHCLLCSHESGEMERTDGIFIWPTSLLHYVREHDVFLPKYFLDHVRQVGYQYPRDFPSQFAYIVERDLGDWLRL